MLFAFVIVLLSVVAVSAGAHASAAREAHLKVEVSSTVTKDTDALAEAGTFGTVLKNLVFPIVSKSGFVSTKKFFRGEGLRICAPLWTALS